MAAQARLAVDTCNEGAQPLGGPGELEQGQPLVPDDRGGRADRVRGRRLADLAAGADQDDAEGRAGFQAAADHQSVARLEDVEGEGQAGKEDDVEREERQRRDLTHENLPAYTNGCAHDGKCSRRAALTAEERWEEVLA